MRRNHVHDKDLLDKIERRLTDGEPTGFEVIDDLADTVPRADPRFQDELEARLMIRMQSRDVKQEKDEKPMQAIVSLPKTNRLPHFVFKPSLTLIAAILVMVLVGAALLMLNNGDGSQPEFGAGFLTVTQDETATPIPTFPETPPPTSTPIMTDETPSPVTTDATSDMPPTPVPTETMPYTPTPILSPTATASPIGPVVPNVEIPAEAVIAVPPSTLRMVALAARDLPAGTEIHQSDVILTYWPAEFAPEAFDGLINIVLRRTTRDIVQWQPIMFGDVQ